MRVTVSEIVQRLVSAIIVFMVVANYCSGQESHNLTDSPPATQHQADSTNAAKEVAGPVAQQVPQLDSTTQATFSDNPRTQNSMDAADLSPPRTLADTRAEQPPIDMNMLRQQIEPPNDANVIKKNQVYQVDPMKMLAPDRMAPTTIQNPHQRTSGQHANLGDVQRAAQIPGEFRQFNDLRSTERINNSILVPRNNQTGRLASFNNPVDNGEGSGSEKSGKPNLKTAKLLVQQFDVSNVQSTLPGVPASMLELLEKVQRNEQEKLVDDYWSTYRDWAKLLNARRYLYWLNQLPVPNNQTENILLQTAKSEANNNVLAAEIRLNGTQLKLQELVKQTDPALATVIPLDQPLVSKYKTHYEWYDSRNLVPARLKGVDRMLPKTLELISSRANTVVSAKSATKQTQIAFTNGQTPIASVLEAGRLWQDSLDSFVDTVVNYNQTIGAYAMSISNRQRTPQQIVGMLISTPKAEDVLPMATRQVAEQIPQFRNQLTGQGALQKTGFSQQVNERSQMSGPGSGVGSLNTKSFGSGTSGAGTGNADMSRGTTAKFGDTPIPAGSQPMDPNSTQPFSSGGAFGGSSGSTFRPTTPDPNRTTDNSNSFGGGNFQRK